MEIIDARTKEEREKLINILESKAFKIVDITKEEILSSNLPITVDLENKEISQMGNVTCAAAAASSKGLQTVEEFMKLLEEND